MVVITDVSVPSGDFALGDLLDEYPDISIEIERIVPLRESVMPLIWVENAPLEELEATIRSDPITEKVRVITNADERTLFEIHWSSEIDGLVDALFDNEADVLLAVGDETDWEFRLQFDSRLALRSFREQCADEGIDVQFRRLYSRDLSEEDHTLTDEQSELMLVALDLGYWDVPRKNTLDEVAAEVGISKNAASQRLRRGIKTLAEHELVRRE